MAKLQDIPVKLVPYPDEVKGRCHGCAGEGDGMGQVCDLVPTCDGCIWKIEKQ